MQYVISWEKDESDVYLEGAGSSFVPGVTHLQPRASTHLQPRASKLPPGQAHPSSKSAVPPTNTKTKKSAMKSQRGSKHTQGAPDQSSLHEKRKDVTLNNLRPEDKKKVANLIKELAKVGEEKEEVMGQLTVEREQFKSRYDGLEAQVNTLRSEREAIQQQYLKCQMLLAQSQEKLSREQIQQQKQLRNVEPERDLSTGKRPRQEGFSTAQPQQVPSSSKDTQQFQPVFQSTTKPRQASAIPGPPSHSQAGHPVTAHLPERGPSNPFSTTIFSADEFHPLPEELCSTSLGLPDGADVEEPVRETDLGGSRQMRESKHHHSLDRTGLAPKGQKHFQKHRDVGGAYYGTGGLPAPVRDHQYEHHMYPNDHLYQNHLAEVVNSHQNRNPPSPAPTGMEGKSTNYHQRLITPEQLSQSNGEGIPLDSDWNPPHRNGNPPKKKGIATPDLLVERKKRLEGQKAQLRREQNWLREQLKNQAELLHQKQLELEAHRQSLLDSPHPRGQSVGWALESESRENGVIRSQQGHQVSSGKQFSEIDRVPLGKRVIEGDQGFLPHGGDYLGHNTGPFQAAAESYPERDAGANCGQDRLLYERQLLQTDGQSSHGGKLGIGTRQSVSHNPHLVGRTAYHPNERIGLKLGRSEKMRHNEQAFYERQLLRAHGHPGESRVSNDSREQASAKQFSHQQEERVPELANGSYQYKNQEPVDIGHHPLLTAHRVVGNRGREIGNNRHEEPVGISSKQFVVYGSKMIPGQRMESAPQEGRDLIEGSVALHSDSITGGRQGHDPWLHRAVDVSTSSLKPPHPPGRGMSPAVHHPGSGLTSDAWRDDPSSEELSSMNHCLPSGEKLSTNYQDEDDLNLLHDLIEDLNRLPSEGSKSRQSLAEPVSITARAPTSIHHQSNGFGRHHHRADRTELQATHGRGAVVDNPGLAPVIGSEVEGGSDEEEESRILDDIFFLS